MAISLKAARINAGLTQVQAAKALGVNKHTLANYEAYRTSPDMATGNKIAELYGLTVDAIAWAQS